MRRGRVKETQRHTLSTRFPTPVFLCHTLRPPALSSSSCTRSTTHLSLFPPPTLPHSPFLNSTDKMTMTKTVTAMLALVSLVGLVSGASEEKMVPMSIAVSEGGLQGLGVGYQQPYVPQQQQTYAQVPYNQAVAPPNYGNQPGPSENAIAPNVNPYPRQSYCIVTGYPCNVSSECCTAGCDIFGPVSQCCIPEGQVCDFSRPTHANQYSCCYPLSCDPYKATGLTVCQERLNRYPDSGRNRGLGEAAVAGVQKLVSVPWYSDQNPLWKHDSGKEGNFEEQDVPEADDVDEMTTTK